MLKRLLLVQARMGSTRLPGKVLLDIGGKTMLERVVARARRARTADEVAVATSLSPGDDAVVREAGRLGLRAYRGSEERVLDRYYEAAKAFGADVVIRVTADCPLIDPEIIDKVVNAFSAARPSADFATNTL